MNNNKGITLVTVVVMIIVMLIIVTVSIVAGNKLILNSKEYSDEEEYQSVKAAVLRKKAEINMAGSLIPIGESYVGIKDPILQSDGVNNIVATGWYFLDKENLEKLGVYDVESRYLVNYDYEVVLNAKDVEYLEEYMLVECMYNLISSDMFIGTELKNKSSSDTSAKMMKNKKTGDLYGTGWYLLKKTTNGITGDFGAEYEKYIKHDYLVNYTTKEYIKIDSNYEEI